MRVRKCSVHSIKPKRCRGTSAQELHLLGIGPGGSSCRVCGECCENMRVKLDKDDAKRILTHISSNKEALERKGIGTKRLIRHIQEKSELPLHSDVARKGEVRKDSCVFLTDKQ